MSLSLAQKGQISKIEFVVALVSHAIFDDKIFAFANQWLFSETLATILCSIYNLSGPTSFTAFRR